jgi:hypothetical protein
MPTEKRAGVITGVADGAIARYTRVKYDSNCKITTAVLTDVGIGTADNDTAAAGELLAVRLNDDPGTRLMIAAAAISAGVPVYTAAAGRVSATAASTSFRVGWALTAATAAGDLIEVAPMPLLAAQS